MIRRVIVKRTGPGQRKKETQDAAYQPPEEIPEPGLGGFMESKDSWDAYAMSCARSDADKLQDGTKVPAVSPDKLQDGTMLPADVNTAPLEVPVAPLPEAPLPEGQPGTPNGTSHQQPPIKPKDESKSPKDQMIEVLTHMGYSCEECEDALMMVGSNPTNGSCD